MFVYDDNKFSINMDIITNINTNMNMNTNINNLQNRKILEKLNKKNA